MCEVGDSRQGDLVRGRPSMHTDMYIYIYIYIHCAMVNPVASSQEVTLGVAVVTRGKAPVVLLLIHSLGRRLKGRATSHS